MERLRYGQSCSAFGEDLLAAVGDEHVRRSSKRARDRPHKKKERPPGPPILGRLRGLEKAGIYAMLTSHARQFN